MAWNELASRYLSLLFNPEEAPAKIKTDLRVTIHDFDKNLEEVMAEILAVINLASLGGSEFRALISASRNGQKTPDFLCKFEDRDAVVEAKNLRAHRYIENVMFRLYRDEQRKGNAASNYKLAVLRSDWNSSDRKSLGKTERAGEEEIREVLRKAESMARNVVHEITVPFGTVRFRIEDLGDSRIEDGVTGQDFHSPAMSRAMLDKIGRVAKDKAMPQLFSQVASDVSCRILAMRWDLPHYETARSVQIPKVLDQEFEEKIFPEIGKRFGVLMFSDYGIEWNALRWACVSSDERRQSPAQPRDAQ